MNRDRTSEAKREGGERGLGEGVPGIVIADGRRARTSVVRAPRIHAFVWGGRVRPTPTLPYGRWKGAA